MIPAIVELHSALLQAGYTEEQADELAARFMEEEAYDYVEVMSKIKEPYLAN